MGHKLFRAPAGEQQTNGYGLAGNISVLHIIAVAAKYNIPASSCLLETMEYSRLPPRTHYTYVQSSRKVRCRKGDVVVSVRPPRKQRPTEKNSYSRSLLLTASWCSVKTVGSSMSEHQYYRPTRSLLVHIFFPPKSEEPRTLLLLLPLLLLLLVLQGCNSLSFG